MKKLILPVILFAGFCSCSKDHTPPANKGELLSEIVLTQGGLTNRVKYEYNEQGKIIQEGDVTYLRDEQQRIKEIIDPNTLTNRKDVFVYYNDALQNKVSYTLSKVATVDAVDSTVYIHDEKGRLQKTVSYFNGTLDYYDLYFYDNTDNLITDLHYVMQITGTSLLCSEDDFDNYTTTSNPLYSDDEVRLNKTFWNSLLNTSKNSFTQLGLYVKTFSYREDGKPINCLIHRDGTQDFTISFIYQ